MTDQPLGPNEELDDAALQDAAGGDGADSIVPLPPLPPFPPMPG